MHVQQIDYEGSDSVGLHGFCTETYAVLPQGFKHSTIFDVPVIETTVNYATLNGLYLAGNRNGVITSDILYPQELDRLNEHVDVTIIDTRHTAVGNLVLCNSHGAYISPFLEDHREQIQEALQVPVTVGTVAGLDIVGSCGVATDEGVLLHRDTAEDELAQVEEALHVDADIGSVNFGSPYIKAGLLANSNAYVTGTDTTAVEIQRIDKTLGFLD